MKKLKMHSPNFAEENIERLAELFPDCVTESTDEEGNLKKSIDFDLLRQELSSSIVEGPQERYRLDWPGKRKALLTANAPVAKTLRPCRAESVDFDSTENLFIEGDNLDALKLLQETYLGKVKMIYIDPPYNTGKDFVYKDNFAVESGQWLVESGQKDEDGNRLVANTDSNGRFHSDWLSMMYPRLKLARNLLKDDGVIFISIDDNEVHNLRKICDEVFGAENFEGHIHWRRRHNQPNDPTKMIGLVAEHIISYSKNKQNFKQSGVGKIELTGKFSNSDNDPLGDWSSKPWKVGSDQNGSKYNITLPNGKVISGEWMGEKITFEKLLADNRIIFPNNGNGFPRKKYYKFEREKEGQCATNWWSHNQFGHNQEANNIMTELMSDIKNIFSNPKPPKLIKNLCAIANTKSNDLILDFFAGSATTAHAVMQLNAEDGGKRKFIMVQLPEVTDEKSEAFKADYKTITEIGKERIRRAGKKILDELTTKDTKDTKENFRAFRGSKKLDIGFRVLKVDSSNIADVYYTPDAVEQDQIEIFTDNIKSDRTSEDLLFQVLLDWGVDLTLPITKELIEGREVFFVDGNALAACFEKNGKITEDFCKELAKRQPLRVVFRDSGFKDDSVKINVEQIFRLMSPHTDVKTT